MRTEELQPPVPATFDTTDTQPSDCPVTDWTCAAWLDSIKATSAVSGALLDSFSTGSGSELDMVRSLCAASESELVTRLLDGQVAKRVAELLHRELQTLRTMEVATGAALHKLHREVQLDPMSTRNLIPRSANLYAGRTRQ